LPPVLHKTMVYAPGRSQPCGGALAPVLCSAAGASPCRSFDLLPCVLSDHEARVTARLEPNTQIELETHFVLDRRGRIVSTREPHGTHGPLMTLIRGTTECAWAVRDDLPERLATEVEALLRSEPPAPPPGGRPAHADRYLALLGGRVGSEGPMFRVPDALPPSPDALPIDSEEALHRHFPGWQPGEIAAGRSPALAIVVDGYPVSVCFCARRSETAAAAGLETAAEYRGLGLAGRVTAAWASAVRASGRVPLYSTSFGNQASRAVAAKLGLTPHATQWSVVA